MNNGDDHGILSDDFVINEHHALTVSNNIPSLSAITGTTTGSYDDVYDRLDELTERVRVLENMLMTKHVNNLDDI